MNPHDDPEASAANPRLTFGEIRDGGVMVAQRKPGFVDFYLVVNVDKKTRRLHLRTVDGKEFWFPWWAFDQHITQSSAEMLGARWRVAPQERPHLVGPGRHPHNPLKD